MKIYHSPSVEELTIVSEDIITRSLIYQRDDEGWGPLVPVETSPDDDED